MCSVMGCVLTSMSDLLVMANVCSVRGRVRRDVCFSEYSVAGHRLQKYVICNKCCELSPVRHFHNFLAAFVFVSILLPPSSVARFQ